MDEEIQEVTDLAQQDNSGEKNDQKGVNYGN